MEHEQERVQIDYSQDSLDDLDTAISTDKFVETAKKLLASRTPVSTTPTDPKPKGKEVVPEPSEEGGSDTPLVTPSASRWSELASTTRVDNPNAVPISDQQLENTVLRTEVTNLSRVIDRQQTLISSLVTRLDQQEKLISTLASDTNILKTRANEARDQLLQINTEFLEVSNQAMRIVQKAESVDLEVDKPTFTEKIAQLSGSAEKTATKLAKSVSLKPVSMASSSKGKKAKRTFA